MKFIVPFVLFVPLVSFVPFVPFDFLFDAFATFARRRSHQFMRALAGMRLRK